MSQFINFPLSFTRFDRPPLWDAFTGACIASRVTVYYGMQKPGAWRFVVCSPDPAVCGPIFKTKAELLSALPDYAKGWGF